MQIDNLVIVTVHRKPHLLLLICFPSRIHVMGCEIYKLLEQSSLDHSKSRMRPFSALPLVLAAICTFVIGDILPPNVLNLHISSNTTADISPTLFGWMWEVSLRLGAVCH